MKKGAKIATIVTASVVLLLFVAVIIYYFGASYKSFDKISMKEFAIPGLETKFTPQGMAFDEKNEKFLISGYMSNDEPSRVYVVDKESGETERFVTLKQGEVDYDGHAGGIAVFNNTCWVASDQYIYRIQLSDIYSAEDEGSVKIVDSFKTNNEASWLSVVDDNLIVGEFHKNGAYPTDEAHYFDTRDGKINRALALAYPIDENRTYGISSTFPRYGISMPSLVQGMCLNKDGDIVLSTSYSVADSHIKVYENPMSESTTHQTTINGITLNVYMLDNTNLKTNLSAPCMSEEIVLVDERVFVLFENNCSKYRFATRTRLKNVFSLEV